LGLVASFLALIILLFLSGLISGSEVAFFSLDASKQKELEELNGKRAELALDLLNRSKELLATILISNNFVNVAIILLSSLLSAALFTFEDTVLLGVSLPADWIAFAVDVVGITFLILLFGEVIPKVYASRYPLDLALIMAYPITVFYRFFNQLQLVPLLVSSTRFIDRTLKKRSAGISVDELSHALDITDKEDIGEEDHKILQGIVKFGNTDVRQIMTSRVDVTGFDLSTPYEDLLQAVLESGYSRIPVFEDDFDNIKGVLYLKDLLPYLKKEPNTFNWNELIREPFFVPEKKKIDDLLNEFRERKMHIAIVVDEYGGSQGIVTLEDVIEEIVGNISDEFDDEDLVYSKLDDRNVVFEGKTALNDVYRVLEISGDELEAVKGESDTLAGLIIEYSGRIPKKNERIDIEGYRFTVEAADKKRVKRIKVTLPDSTDGESEDDRKSNSSGLVSLMLILGLGLGLSSCEETYFPKPKSYYRIELPKAQYDSLGLDCPFTFRYNTRMAKLDYMRVKPEEKENCWFNLYYPKLKARVHFSYFNNQVSDSLSNYTETSRKLAMKHLVKAKDIKENRIFAPDERVYGLTYDFEGSTASAFQFFVTDSLNHYMHASLYFETHPNPDSLLPAERYIKQDLLMLIESFEWKE
jgi:gliding motility-associated lipoprotein GldD